MEIIIFKVKVSFDSQNNMSQFEVVDSFALQDTNKSEREIGLLDNNGALIKISLLFNGDKANKTYNLLIKQVTYYDHNSIIDKQDYTLLDIRLEGDNQ